MGIPEISGELGVAHILEGSVRKSGDRIRITAQTDRHLWSNNFDRELDDIFAIQENPDKAFEWLEISYENHDGGLSYLLVEYWDAMPGR